MPLLRKYFSMSDTQFTDAEYERIKDICDPLIDKWRAAMGLNTWRININYRRVPMDGQEPSDTTALADILVRWEYLEARLRINTFGIWERAMSADDIEETIVHELCHIHVAELRSLVDDDKFSHHILHEERVVSSLTNAMLWSRQMGRDEVSKDTTETFATGGQIGSTFSVTPFGLPNPEVCIAPNGEIIGERKA